MSAAPTSVSCLVVQGPALILLLSLCTFAAETTNFASQKPLYIWVWRGWEQWCFSTRCGSAASASCVGAGGWTPLPLLSWAIWCVRVRYAGPLLILQLLKHLMVCRAFSLVTLFLGKRAIATTIEREKPEYPGQSFTYSHAMAVQKTRDLKLWLSVLIPKLFLVSLWLGLSPCSYWPFMSYSVL